jgi:hypothetical protein
LLLFNKAEFPAWKELEKEYLETPHPNPSLLCPHRFYNGTDIDNEDDPERIKYNNWHHTKDHRVTMIVLSIAVDPTKTSDKEDLATTKQVKTELTQRRYHYHTLTSTHGQNPQPQLTPKTKKTITYPKRRATKELQHYNPAENYALIMVTGVCSQ